MLSMRILSGNALQFLLYPCHCPTVCRTASRLKAATKTEKILLCSLKILTLI